MSEQRNSYRRLFLLLFSLFKARISIS